MCALVVNFPTTVDRRWKLILKRVIREGMQGKASPSQAGIEYTSENVVYISSMYLSRLPLMCSFIKANVHFYADMDAGDLSASLGKKCAFLPSE